MTLLELLQLLRKHLRFVVLLPVAFAVVTAVYCLFLPNEYTASTSMYVLSKSDDSSTAVTQTDLSAAQMLTSDVAELIQSDRVKGDVAEELGLDNLDDYEIDVTSSTSTRVIDLSVTGTDASGAADVANALVTDTSDVAAQVMDVQSVNVIDSAATPTSPSGPRRTLYVAVAFLVGLFAAVVVVVVADMADLRIRNSKDVEELVDLPVVGHFPNVEGM